MHGKHFAVFFGGSVHLINFFGVHSHGFFDYHVFPAGHRFERVRLVQIVGRRYKHDFNAFVGKDLFGAVEIVQPELSRKLLSFLAYIVNPRYFQLFGIIAVVEPRNNVFSVVVSHSAVSDNRYFHKISVFSSRAIDFFSSLMI